MSLIRFNTLETRRSLSQQIGFKFEKKVKSATFGP